MKRIITIIIIAAIVGCAAREPYERNKFYTFVSKHQEEKHQDSYKVAQGFCVHYTNDFDTFNRCMDYQLTCYKKVDDAYQKIMTKKGELYTSSMVKEYYRSRQNTIEQVKGIDHCDLYNFLKTHLDAIKRTDSQSRNRPKLP